MAKKKKRKPTDDDVRPSKKRRSREYDDEDDLDEDDGTPRKRNDVYVGLSVVTLLALLTSAVFLYLDHDANSKKQPPTVTVSVDDLKLERPARGR